MSERLLANNVCLVTGGGKGIGKAIAEAFAEAGAIVHVNARTAGSIDEWCHALATQHQTQVFPQYFDVTDFTAVKEALLSIKKQHGHIDTLVNNAGLVSYELIPMIDFSKFRQMLDVNVTALIHLVQLSSRIMSRQKSGSIINISSIVGVRGMAGQLAYAATKGAVDAVTKSAAKELSPHHIRVNSVAPGMVETERLVQEAARGFEDKVNQIGFGRMAKPAEVAQVVLFLASPMSSYITGQVIGVDGGAMF